MNRNWRYATFRICFKASLEEVIMMGSEKMKAIYIMEDVWKSFFRKLAG